MLGAVLGGVLVVLVVCGCTVSRAEDTSDPTPRVEPVPTTARLTTGTTGSTAAATGSIGPSAPTSSTTDVSDESPDEPRQVTVVMNGDMLLHEGLWASARTDARRTGRGPDGMDFRPLLADMRPVVSGADLAICHLETPVAPRGGPFAGYPMFSVPPAILPALKWEGYDACTTASNHSIDQGFEGLTRTLHDLDAVGLAHAGTAATRAASRRPLLLEVGDVTVGLVSATYGTNGLPLPDGKPWSVPLIDTGRIEAMAHQAREQGADIVLVALHWGLEYQHAPTSEQEAIAEELTNSPDINLVYGHHAHVVQPYDVVHGRWVVYGLGNAVAQQDTAVEGVYDGNTCRVTFTERPDGDFRVSRLEYIPTMITHYDGVHPMRWLNVPRALTESRYAGLRPALRATQQRVRDVVGSHGALRRGVTEGS